MTMTDWNTRANDMVKMWTESQNKMWENWVSTMKGMGSMGTAPNGRETWMKTVEVWQDSVKTALDAQVTWTQFWTESMTSMSGSSKQMNDWSAQTMEMTKQWTEAQNKMWNDWFESLKTMDTAAMMKSFNPDEMMKLMQTWQDSARKMMETQMEMVRSMTSAQMKSE